MNNNFKQLVDSLSLIPLPNAALSKITLIIEQQTSESFSSFFSQSVQSIFILEHWVWQRLACDCHQWINQPNYIHLFYALASFNKNLIFKDDTVDDETKASVLIPDIMDQIDGIFEQINQTDDDNDAFIGIINLWFDNLSLFIGENPQFNRKPIICYINQYICRNYLMTNLFKFYLTQLEQPIFSAKQLFYIKICVHSLSSHLTGSIENFPFTADEMLHHIGNQYLQIMNIHSQKIESWDKELLACITYLTGFIRSCCCSYGEKIGQLKILFPTEQILCDYTKALIRIISYKPFYKEIQPKRLNNETILIYNILMIIVLVLHTQNIHWYFRSDLSLPDTLLIIAENSTFDEICLCAYAALGEILIDEKLKELKVADNISVFFHNILQQAWNHPLKKYKDLSITDLLRGFSSLTKSDSIQQKIADSNELLLLVELCDQYPIVYDILWALSFNKDIQQQLRSNSIFMSKLSHLLEECDNEQMKKITHGLLWNLEINHDDRSTGEIKERDTFDIMISYSHKDKILCQQIYDELIKAGYHVWIDFDRMHGNVMDAMAQAIECSQTVIICMSEDYRKSNYCRAEAHYAFQRERKIVPILLQKHYKPDGWLLFLVGQLKYIDFIKYEFNRAMEMLFKELKGTHIVETNAVVLELKKLPTNTLPKLCLPTLLPKNILDWTQTHVQEWLVTHNLHQMACFLADCNGRSLLYLDEYIRNGDRNQMLNLLQEDSFRKIGQTLSLIELACFRSLMDEQKQFMGSNISSQLIKSNNKKCSFICCRMM